MRTATQDIDYTSRDYTAYKELLIDKLQEKIPEYTDTSETDVGIVILEALANGLDICSYYNDAVANDVILATTQDRRLAVLIAQDLGYSPYNQTASIIPVVFTLEVEQDEDIVIGRGTIVTNVESDDVEAIQFETTEDLVIPSGKLGNEKDEDGNYIYSVTAVQGETIEDDYIGSSNGTAYQTFTLNYPEVLVDTIEIYVDEGDGEVLWSRVDNFQDCDEDTKAYIVMVDEYDNCTIEFGSGVRGKIPSVFDNGIRATYRVGGGDIGNVQPNTVTVIETDIPYVDECFNLEPITYGHEKESIEEIRYNGPAFNRVRDRAVILEDYEDLITINVSEYDDFYGIYNTKAVRDEEDLMHAILYYQMRDGYTMTQELQDLISDFFAPRSMLGTSLTLEPYVTDDIDLKATLIVEKDYKRSEVKEEVEEYLKSYFEYGQFTFGDEIVKSSLEEEVKSSIEGVKSFRITDPVGDVITSDAEYKIFNLASTTLTVSGGDA